MLNTNQSNQRKSWKYALILPVLSVFMLLFQVETVAQVKESNFEITNNSSIISKNSSDKELNKLEKKYSDENQNLTISNIKRNKKGEIIEIKLSLDSGKTYNRVLESKSDNPINDIKIFLILDDNKSIVNFEEIATNTIEKDSLFENKYISLDNLKKNGKEIVLIINGKIKEPEEKIKLLKNEKLGERKQISGTEFEKTYHQKADKNKLYFEVQTMPLDYDFVTTTFDIFDTNEMRFQMKNEIVKENEKALYLFNGKEISIKEAKNIKGEQISEIIEILSSALISNYGYGEKGKNGVIKINSEIEKPNSERNRLYIINGKEYLQSEIPKGTTVEVDGSISDLSKEEGIKKYGQKAKDGVLIFEGKSTFVNDIDNQDLIKLKSESIILNHNLPNNKTFTLSNGYQVVVMENKRIKIPEYPKTILSKVPLYFNDKNISESEFIKMNYNDIKSIKVNKVEGTSGKDLRVKEIYFYSK